MKNTIKNTIKAAAVASIAFTFAVGSTTAPAHAGNDLVEGVVGGFFGAAILNELQKAQQAAEQKKKRKSGGRAKADPVVKEIQSLLNQLGFPAGTADGLYGKKTKNALNGFYGEYGGEYDGKADDNELADLRLIASGTQARLSTNSPIVSEDPTLLANTSTDFKVRMFEDIPYVAQEYATMFDGDLIQTIRVDTMTYK